MATAAMMQNQQALLTSRRSTSTASTKRGCGAVVRTTHRRRGGVVKCRAASAEDVDKESGGGGGEKMVVAVTGATGKGRPLVFVLRFVYLYFFSLDFKRRASTDDERCSRGVLSSTVGKTSVMRDEAESSEGGVTLLVSE